MIQTTIQDVRQHVRFRKVKECPAHYLYLVINSDGKVLYVGLSSGPIVRLHSHLIGSWPTRLGQLVKSNLPQSEEWIVVFLTLSDCEPLIRQYFSVPEDWYNDCANIRDVMELAERALIKHYQPTLNTAHNTHSGSEVKKKQQRKKRQKVSQQDLQVLIEYLDLPLWKISDINEDEQSYSVIASPRSHASYCPKCGSKFFIGYGRDPQVLRDLPRYGKWVEIQFDHPRLRCRSCKKTFFLPLPDVHPKRFMTQRLVDYMREEASKRTCASVAQEVGLHEITVRRICLGLD